MTKHVPLQKRATISTCCDCGLLPLP